MGVDIVIERGYEDDADILWDIQNLYDEMGEVLHDGRNTVRRVEYEGKVYIAKRFKRPMLFQRIAYTWFRKSKARRAYDNAKEYERRGIATPARIAMVERRSWGLFDRGFYICHEDTRPSLMAFTDHPETMDDALVEALACQLYALHQKHQVINGDLNLSNILYDYDEASGGYRFCFIDINRSRLRSRPLSHKEIVGDLWRLTHNRLLARRILSAYARQWGWDEQALVDEVIQRIEREEKKKRCRYRLTFREYK